MLLKCCTQYVSKCGKLSSSHRTAKGQFSFQFQRRAVSKNIQNTAQVHSFHVLERLCSKFFNLGFSSMWTKNFQTYKLSFEEAEESEIKLPTFAGSWKKQGSSRKTSTFVSLTMLKPLTMWITTNWKILKEMGVSDHLTCLMRNLYAGQEATVRTGHETDWLKTGKWVRQGCILSPCLFNFYAEYIMWNAKLDESQAGIKIARRNINNLRYADDTTLMVDSFFGRNDAKAETPVFWPPHEKSWLIGKHSDAGRDWGQEEKGTTEDEMAGWHHRPDGHESEWTLGVGDGQGGLVCCDSWGRKESDMTERLNLGLL